MSPLPGADVDARPLRARILDPRPPLQVSFSHDGQRIAYLRIRGDRRVVVVRDVAREAEVEIDPGPGTLGRLAFDPTGRWLMLQVAARDTDGNGKVEWPEPFTSLAPEACRGPVTSFSVRSGEGDEPSFRVAPSGGGEARDVPEGFVTMLGDAMLVRRDDGAIVQSPGDGASTELVPAACAGRIRWGDPGRKRILVHCQSGAVELHGPEEHRAVGRVREPLSRDLRRWEVGPLVELGGSEPPAFLDAERDVVVTLAPGETLVAIRGRRILVARGRVLVLRDVERKVDRRLMTLEKEGGNFSVAGPMIALGGAVMDLDRGQVLGHYEEPVLAVSSAGRVLVAAEIYDSGWVLPRGPLWWRAPDR
jgi:hypothetical protein